MDVYRIYWKLKKVFLVGLFLLLLYALFNFLWELYLYQVVHLPMVWSGLSQDSRTLININLGFMDFKVLGTIGLLVWMLRK